METITRYSRKIKMTVIKAVVITFLLLLLYMPTINVKGFAEDIGYYVVMLNGEKIGAVNSAETAEEALLEARLKISAEAGSMVYMDPELEVIEEDTIFGTRMSESELAEAMYVSLADAVISFDKQAAYTVRIDDYTVTLASKDEVVELIEAVKADYDAENEFQIRLVNNDDSEYGIDIVKAGIGNNDAAKVLSNVDGQTVVEVKEDTVFEDGVLQIGFDKEITVIPTEIKASQITSVADALADITKETEAKTIYEVVAGDCLSTIAQQYGITTADIIALNEGMTEKSIIGIGDEIVVTVPTPELSVVVTEEITYEEAYNAPIQYIDDDTMYVTEEVVVQSGSEGVHEVVAVVTYKNGYEQSREIIRETLIVEAVPQIVRRGTLTPPTFIKPINGGTFTSGFGARWGTTHNGVDWGTPVGTAVKASASGTVIRAGWYSGYGYCVDIQHSNGVVTRYGHLSQTLVSVGETVTQGEKIALSGNTGYSTGPHLHFEIRIGGTPVNPLDYLN